MVHLEVLVVDGGRHESRLSIEIIFFQGRDHLEAFVNMVMMLRSFGFHRNKFIRFVKWAVDL
jgi:hypothetical protein